MEIKDLEDLPGTFGASKNGDNHYIDDIDLKLLELLIENSRIFYAELARAVGLSRVGAKNHVNELKKKGIIEKFTILVPSKYFGLPLPVFFEISVSPDELENIANEIKKHRNIAIVYHMSGGSSLHVHGFFENPENISSFLKTFLLKIPGIRDVKTEFLLHRYKIERHLMI